MLVSSSCVDVEIFHVFVTHREKCDVWRVSVHGRRKWPNAGGRKFFLVLQKIPPPSSSYSTRNWVIKCLGSDPLLPFKKWKAPWNRPDEKQLKSWGLISKFPVIAMTEESLTGRRPNTSGHQVPSFFLFSDQSRQAQTRLNLHRLSLAGPDLPFHPRSLSNRSCVADSTCSSLLKGETAVTKPPCRWEEGGWKTNHSEENILVCTKITTRQRKNNKSVRRRCVDRVGRLATPSLNRLRGGSYSIKSRSSLFFRSDSVCVSFTELKNLRLEGPPWIVSYLPLHLAPSLYSTRWRRFFSPPELCLVSLNLLEEDEAE